MTDTTSDKPVHSPLVPDFRIQRFAGIKDLTVPAFGQVTLVVGDNGVGKSTLLDALRVYARKGDDIVLKSILKRRNLYARSSSDEILKLDWGALFNRTEPSEVVLSTASGSADLRMKVLTSIEEVTHPMEQEILMCCDALALDVNGQRGFVPMTEASDELPLRSFPVTKTMSIETVQLTDDVDWGREKDMLFMSAGDSTDDVFRSWRKLFGLRVAMMELMEVDGSDKRHPFARLDAGGGAFGHIFPLRSEGDARCQALLHLMAMRATPYGSRQRLVLADDYDNGLHFSRQSRFWRAMIHLAELSGNQFVGTTNRLDIAIGFARAALTASRVSCSLLTLGKQADGSHEVTETSAQSLLDMLYGGSDSR